MNSAEYAKALIGELGTTLAQISVDESERFVTAILGARQLFVAGAGRSGLMGKAFAMRLMHMGFESHVVGESVTPNIGPGDLLIIGSGSGETGSLVAMAAKARKLEVDLALISIFPDSTIGKLADLVITIPAPSPKVESRFAAKSIQPMGSLFEQSLLLFMDTIILQLMERKADDSKTMFERHANLE